MVEHLQELLLLNEDPEEDEGSSRVENNQIVSLCSSWS
jgi:hypothetical protein